MAGYDHYFDEGTKPLPCQERANDFWRGGIWFDLSEIRKLPGVLVTSASLHFRPVENVTRMSDGKPFPGTKYCANELLVASVDWRKGYKGLPPGGPFKSLSQQPGKGVVCDLGGGLGGLFYCSVEVGPVVNNWVTGKEDDFGFVIKGEDEAFTTEDNAACWTRYDNFELVVNYKYDTHLIFPLETATPSIPIGRPGPGIPGDVGAAQIGSQTDTAFGLITTTFDTLKGTVSVNLPDDVAAGDTISGTVITQPKGATKDEQAKNEDSLNGYVVEVAKQENPKQQQQGSKWVIPPAAQFIPVVLKNREGKVVAQTQVPLGQGNVVKTKPNGDIPDQGYSTPPLGQAGRPVSVAGPFDGDFNNTAIKLGNNTAQFLAESPRKVVVRSPANLIGPAPIEVSERGRIVARCNYQSVGVRLAADKLSLIRGEQTTLTLTLNGLDGVTTPVSVQLTNASPGTIRMEGGESQVVTAQPQEFTGGVFTTRRTLTGVSAGGFNINAVVNSNTYSPNGRAAWKSCSSAGPPGP